MQSFGTHSTEKACTLLYCFNIHLRFHNSKFSSLAQLPLMYLTYTFNRLQETETIPIKLGTSKPNDFLFIHSLLYLNQWQLLPTPQDTDSIVTDVHSLCYLMSILLINFTASTFRRPRIIALMWL